MGIVIKWLAIVVGWITGPVGWLSAKVEAALSAMFGLLVHGRAAFVSPRTVVRRAVREADRASVNWGVGDIEYPNSFEVMLDPASWDSYYGSVVHASEGRIADALASHFSKVGGHSGRLEVLIAVDPSLGRGRVRVSARFDERAGECGETPAMAVGGRGAAAETRGPAGVVAPGPTYARRPAEGPAWAACPGEGQDGDPVGAPGAYYGATPVLVVSPSWRT